MLRKHSTSNLFPFVTLTALLSVSISCAENVEPTPVTRLGQDQHPSQTLVIFNNLSLREFLAAITSKSDPERHYAEMYLLGILDATEGREWCGYDHVLPHSAESLVYSKAKSMEGVRGDERAGRVIREILSTSLACRSGK